MSENLISEWNYNLNENETPTRTLGGGHCVIKRHTLILAIFFEIFFEIRNHITYI